MRGDRIVISGASGLIGSALTRSLRDSNTRVVHLVRRPARSIDEVEWTPGSAPLDPEVLAGARAVINLNGASIGRLPWTRSYRATLLESRLLPTRTLADALRALGANAPHFLSASAVGFYGDRPGEKLSEQSSPGATFLAELCAEWERAALSAGPAASVTLLRTASLLHPRGVLKPLLPLTRLGLSGPLGGGAQSWPWISLEDEVSAIRHIIDERITGPVNLSGPQPATANEIGRALARQVRRPFLLPAPAWALRLILGRTAADSLLLADAAVTPQALLETGFRFQHTTPDVAINAAIRRAG